MSSSMAINILEQSSELVEKYAKYISKELKEEDHTQLLDDLASYILYFSKSVQYYEASEKIYQDLVKKVDEASENTDLSGVLEEFEGSIKNIDEELAAKEVTEEYTNFKKTLTTNGSTIDDDITAVSQNLNTVDPVSKLPITDPVKNVNCGHVYDRATIIEYISHNPKTKCPVAGCDAADYIKKSDLVAVTRSKRVIGLSKGNTKKKARVSSE